MELKVFLEMIETNKTLKDILEKIKSDPKLKELLSGGSPRPGHPEGMYGAHVDEVLKNIAQMNLSDEKRMKLEILAWVHDSFKGMAKKPTADYGVPIEDPQSHGSLARDYLSQYTNDSDMLNIAKYHDYPHSLFRREQRGQNVDKKIEEFLSKFQDKDLLTKFNIADSKTGNKSQDSLNWWLNKIKQ